MQIDSSLYEDFLFSCVVDSNFKFQSQVHSWATSLIDLAGVPGRAIVVHTVASLDPALESWLRDAGVEIRAIAPFRGHGSNQLAQTAGDLRQACGYRTTAANHSDPHLCGSWIGRAALGRIGLVARTRGTFDGFEQLQWRRLCSRAWIPCPDKTSVAKVGSLVHRKSKPVWPGCHAHRSGRSSFSHPGVGD